MNKRKIALLSVLLLLTCTTAMAEGQPSTYKGYPAVQVKKDGQLLSSDVPGINMDGTTLVPVRVIAEAAGLQVGWDGASSTVLLASAAPAAVKETQPAAQTESKQDTEVKQLHHELVQVGTRVKDLNYRLSHVPNYSDQQAGYALKSITVTWVQDINNTILALTERVGKLADDTAERKDIKKTFLEVLSKELEALNTEGQAITSYTMYLDSKTALYKDNFYMQLDNSFDLIVKQLDTLADLE